MPTYDTAYPAIAALHTVLNNYAGVVLFGLGVLSGVLFVYLLIICYCIAEAVTEPKPGTGSGTDRDGWEREFIIQRGKQ